MNNVHFLFFQCTYVFATPIPAVPAPQMRIRWSNKASGFSSPICLRAPRIPDKVTTPVPCKAKNNIKNNLLIWYISHFMLSKNNFIKLNSDFSDRKTTDIADKIYFAGNIFVATSVQD